MRIVSRLRSAAHRRPAAVSARRRVRTPALTDATRQELHLQYLGR